MTEPLRPEDLADLNDAAAGLMPDDPAAIGSTYGRTDYGNARRVALYEASNVRYVNDVDAWYTWCTDRWCQATRGDEFGVAARVALCIERETEHLDDEDDRTRHAQWSQTSLSEPRLRAMLNVATGINELRTPSVEFDARGELLNLLNCTIDLRTLERYPHDRAHMLTQICPTTYVPEARSTLLDSFITRFLPDEKERDYTLQVLAVSALSYGNAARKLILLLGPTSTGKSTLMSLVQSTLGPDYTAAVNPSVFRGNLDDRPRPDLLRTLKTRLVLAFEASERWDLHTDQIKRMTGGDPVTARAMRSDVMNETVATYVPIIVANTVPQIHGSDDALRRRLLALLMDTPIAEDEDDGRKRDELVNDQDARRALLALLTRVYHECGGHVALPIPPRFAELTMEMFAALDDVDEVMRMLKDDGSIYEAPADTRPVHFIQMSVLFRCYVWWIDHNGTQQQRRDRLGSKAFSQRLQSLGYEIVSSNGRRLAGWCMGNTSTTNVARF